MVPSGVSIVSLVSFRRFDCFGGSGCVSLRRFRFGFGMGFSTCLFLIINQACVYLKLASAYMNPSSETQGQLVGAGKSRNGRGKKSGEEKSRTKIGAPGILLLNDQFRNHLKSLPVIGHKNIFVPNQSPALFVLIS